MRHLDDELLKASVPLAAYVADEGLAPQTVTDLVEWGALAADPTHDIHQRLPDSDVLFTWTLWVGDEARSHYDDDAEVELDAALALQPGVEEVDWMDREVFHLAAPTLCRDGVVAAGALALLDDRVRTPSDD
ncbi:hypothetical protein NYO98_07275 [Nocardioides sp. STR2]|uniref:Immunity protein Imm1 n=1 Tax=Nocardioides pini TaxID=2975053 RepID=A0ABT4CB60_9ACTN|nr:hypothetical protein [Nocardioides pini]MCY4726076.1 hypothetical protein [Nocardioides pini]